MAPGSSRTSDYNEGKIHQLEVFINKVVFLKGKTIPEREADELIVYAKALIEDLLSENTLMQHNKTDCR
jgi:hypothetical protein